MNIIICLAVLFICFPQQGKILYLVYTISVLMLYNLNSCFVLQKQNKEDVPHQRSLFVKDCLSLTLVEL